MPNVFVLVPTSRQRDGPGTCGRRNRTISVRSRLAFTPTVIADRLQDLFGSVFGETLEQVPAELGEETRLHFEIATDVFGPASGGS